MAAQVAQIEDEVWVPQLTIVVTHMSAPAGVVVEAALDFPVAHVVQVVAEAWVVQSAIIA